VNPRITLLSFLLAVALFAPGDKPFNPPKATHAKTYPAVETHEDEQVSVAIDPFDTAEKLAVFRVNFKEHGFLPVRIIVSNDSERMLILSDLTLEYVTARRDKLQPAVSDDLYRRLAKPIKRPDQKGPPLPIPIPLPQKNKPSVPVEVMREINDAMFSPVPVPPHSTQSGFVFFDIAGIDNPEAGARINFAGMKIAGKELFYFDISLDKYLNPQPAK